MVEIGDNRSVKQMQLPSSSKEISREQADKHLFAPQAGSVIGSPRVADIDSPQNNHHNSITAALTQGLSNSSRGGVRSSYKVSVKHHLDYEDAADAGGGHILHEHHEHDDDEQAHSGSLCTRLAAASARTPYSKVRTYPLLFRLDDTRYAV